MSETERSDKTQTGAAATQTALGATNWVAPNPFGETTAYLLLTPAGGDEGHTLHGACRTLAMKLLSDDGDIPWVGTDDLVASLRAMRVDLSRQSRGGVWFSAEVPDDWTAAAVARGYIVLAVGLDPFPENGDSTATSAYLQRHDRVYTALVRIDVHVDGS